MHPPCTEATETGATLDKKMRTMLDKKMRKLQEAIYAKEVASLLVFVAKMATWTAREIVPANCEYGRQLDFLVAWHCWTVMNFPP